MLKMEFSNPLFFIPELAFRLFTDFPKSLAILYGVNWSLYKIVYGYLEYHRDSSKKCNNELISFYIKNNMLFYLKHINVNPVFDLIYYKIVCRVKYINMCKFLFSVNKSPLLLNEGKNIINSSNCLRLFFNHNHHHVQFAANIDLFNYLVTNVCQYKDVVNYFFYECVVACNDVTTKYILENYNLNKKTIWRALQKIIISPYDLNLICILMKYISGKFLYVNVIKNNIYNDLLPTNVISLILDLYSLFGERIFLFYLRNNLNIFFNSYEAPENNIWLFKQFIPVFKNKSNEYLESILNTICKRWEDALEFKKIDKIKIAEMLFFVLMRNFKINLTVDFFKSYTLLHETSQFCIKWSINYDTEFPPL